MSEQEGETVLLDKLAGSLVRRISLILSDLTHTLWYWTAHGS
jgi:hypothetical protein